MRITLSLALSFLFVSAKANIIYVNKNATGSNNGTNWANAYTSLTVAIGSAVSSDTIVVAKATYTPHASSRTVSFDMKDGVKIFGGFAGTESPINTSTIAARNFITNETILSGDLNGDDATTGNAENSYHVVIAQNLSFSLSSSSQLDGFTITGGNADTPYGPGTNFWGGGLFVYANHATNTCDPSFINLRITGNTARGGGGAAVVGYVSGSNFAPLLKKITFTDNLAIDSSASTGGALYISSSQGLASSPTVDSCVFEHNAARVIKFVTGAYGGAIYIWANYSAVCAPIISNSWFCNNRAQHGYALYNRAGQTGQGGTCAPFFRNITIAGASKSIDFASFSTVHSNQSTAASSICQPKFTNAIVYTTSPTEFLGNGQSFFQNSLIKTSGGSTNWNSALGTDLGNNLDTIPYLYDTTSCDFRLYTNSPAYGTGDVTYGYNMGWFQGPGLVYLALGGTLPNVNQCANVTLPTYTFSIADENPNSTVFTVSSTNTAVITASEISITSAGSNRVLSFNPVPVKPGTSTIKIKATNSDLEKDSIEFVYTIYKVPVNPGKDSSFQACSNVYQLINLFGYIGQNTDRGGTWTYIPTIPAFNDSIFLPSSAGQGTFTVTYHTGGATCKDSAKVLIVVNPSPASATFNLPASLATPCINDSSYSINYATPAGGVYSGNGVSGTMLSPSGAGLGPDTIFYVLTNGFGCSTKAYAGINVLATSTVAVSVPAALDTVCINNNNVIMATWASSLAASFTGTGVLPSTSVFDATLAGVGTHTISCWVASLNSCDPDTAYFTITVIPCTGVNEYLQLDDLHIYPNPFADLLTVATDNNSYSEIKMTDLSGKILFNENIISSKTKLERIEMLAPGMYYLEVYNNQKQRFTFKLVKQ